MPVVTNVGKGERCCLEASRTSPHCDEFGPKGMSPVTSKGNSDYEKKVPWVHPFDEPFLPRHEIEELAWECP